MLIALPECIGHLDEKKKRSTIYSLHISPDGRKLVTGGLGAGKKISPQNQPITNKHLTTKSDFKLRIWDMELILRKLEADEEDELETKDVQLATLSLHAGAVLCTRFDSDSGRLLASGSDDTKIVIWELNESAGAYGNLIGLGDDGSRNKETWKAKKVLVGHESDVTDLAWSPDNTILASCGLDSAIFIWSAKSFERLHKIVIQKGFVKGLTWDPVGKFLAAQSDDKSLRIFRVSDWAEEQNITEPYTQGASTTFFRRLSWSPEGSCLVTANGENGSVPVAPIVNRDGWTSEVSLVGHQAPIEVALFNPVMFELPSEDDPDSHKIITGVCALGSQDCGVSVWWTGKARSAAAVKDLFKHSVMDLAWYGSISSEYSVLRSFRNGRTPNGLTLLACSYDGSVAVMTFTSEEFGTPLPDEEKNRALMKYGYKRKQKAIVELPSQLELEQQAGAAEKMRKLDGVLGGGKTATGSVPASMSLGSLQNGSTIGTQKQTETTKNGKKRITPILVSSTSDSTASLFSSSENATQQGTPVNLLQQQQKEETTKSGKKRITPVFVSSLSGEGGSSEGSLLPQRATEHNLGFGNGDILVSGSRVPSSGIPATLGSSIHSKRKAPDDADQPPSKRSNTSNETKWAKEVKYILPTVFSEVTRPLLLALPKVEDRITCMVPLASNNMKPPYLDESQVANIQQQRLESGSSAEVKIWMQLACENNLNTGTCKVTLSQNRSVVWTDVINSLALHVSGTPSFCAVSCVDSSLVVYSQGGRRLLPVMHVENPVCLMDTRESYLMCLTTKAQVYVWNILEQSCTLYRESVAHLIRPEIGSTDCGGSQRNGNGDPAQLMLTIVAATVRANGIPMVSLSDSTNFLFHPTMRLWLKYAVPRPSEIQAGSLKMLSSPAMREREKATLLSTMENTIACLIASNQPQLFRERFHVYARRLSDEAAITKIVELCDDLLGPLYPSPLEFLRDKKASWQPSILVGYCANLEIDLISFAYLVAGNRELQRILKPYSDELNLERMEE
ncbi:WD40-repeat-containing domain protein [Cladochytrium replicatum]|nr:WD40-repeat-containing domain protein [Cladochytrium replicatum]